MTREELIEKICPSDNISGCCMDDCLYVCDGCKLTLESMLDEYDKQIRAEVIGKTATLLEEELTMVMPRDKVKFIMYKVHTVLEQLKEQK